MADLGGEDAHQALVVVDNDNGGRPVLSHDGCRFKHAALGGDHTRGACFLHRCQGGCFSLWGVWYLNQLANGLAADTSSQSIHQGARWGFTGHAEHLRLV